MTETQTLDERVREIVALHFDPRHGAKYWIARAAQLKIDFAHIRSVADLSILGPMESSALAERPVEDFIPQKLHSRKSDFIFAESGGTLGRPAFAVHRNDEFEAAFVTPFVRAATRVDFPRELSWLFIGPTGPHIIGKAARACATAMGSPDPFTVDFDPRWARKLPNDSIARTRYLKHIESQALNVLLTQNIGVLFATPPVLASIAEKIPSSKRNEIRGIHFGGMAVSVELRHRLRDLFSHAVMLSGYGNTLFGVAPEIPGPSFEDLDYFACGSRLAYRVIPFEGRDDERISRQVNIGERGQVLAHRLDETQFIANQLERDSAIRIAPQVKALSDGFLQDGLRNPEPIVNAVLKPAQGLY